jgi:hypothetical protein
MLEAQKQILDRIQGTDSHKVFTSKDFLDIASRMAVDQALSRLVRSGTVQRLGRGLYYFPRINPRLGIPLAA